jgi:hypothetical protein
MLPRREPAEEHAFTAYVWATHYSLRSLAALPSCVRAGRMTSAKRSRCDQHHKLHDGVIISARSRELLSNEIRRGTS